VFGVGILVLIEIIYSLVLPLWELGSGCPQEGVGSEMLVYSIYAAKCGILGFGGVSGWSKNPYSRLIGIDSFVRLGHQHKSG